MSGPSIHVQQHYDGITAPQVDHRAFRQGWRVSTRLDALLRDALIDAATWQMAVHLRATWERAYGVGLGPSGELPASRVVNFDHTLACRLDAASAIRIIKASIGAPRLWLIEQCVVHDAAWGRTAAQLKISDKTARTWTAEALQHCCRCINSETALPIVVSGGE